MDRGPTRVTLEPKVEAAEVETNGGEIPLRAGGGTSMESRVLGTLVLA